ncbi:MAG TPA: amidohydrolase family protein [Bryobacteraceae bacterium]|nr:amidohydrolase family protein [Bryobacteraceae bacterium]
MILANARIVTLDSANRILERGSVEVREDGSIGEIAEAGGGHAGSVDLGGRLLMPALINCHTHLYSTLARGYVLPGPRPKNFPEILKRLWWRLDRALNEEDVYSSALAGLIDSAKCGVATLIDHHSSPNACTGSLDVIARAFEKVGLRGATCYETSDRNGRRSALEAIRENVRFLERRRRGQVAGAFGLHAAFTLSDRTLAACAEANQSLGAAFHVHVAEGAIDGGAVQRLDRHGILNQRTLAAHCVHITAPDRKTLARRGVSVVHNPQSNRNNGVGTAKAAAGVLTGLGTDGFSPRLWDELKMPGGRAPERLLNNRAIVRKIWGLDVGQIATGARADLIAVDYFPPTPLDAGNLFRHLLFGVANAPVDSLIVNGRFLMRDRQLVSVDEARVARKAAARAKALWERL